MPLRKLVKWKINLYGVGKSTVVLSKTDSCQDFCIHFCNDNGDSSFVIEKHHPCSSCRVGRGKENTASINIIKKGIETV